MNGDNAELLREAEKIDENESLYGFPIRKEDGRRSSNRRVYDIQKLWSRHKEILQLDSLGYKEAEIAKMLSIHPVTVSNIINSTLGKEMQLAIREGRDKEYEAMRDSIMLLTWKSLDVYDRILEGEENVSKMQKDTADTVSLELSGLRVPTRIDSRHVGVVLTSQEIEDFKRRGIKAAEDAGKVIKVESESEGAAE